MANGRPGGRRSLRCYGRIQGDGCDEPSCNEDAVDGKVARILGTFAIPEADRARRLAKWRR